MLVLSRRLEETIRIGEDIQIKIVAISGDVVRIGIEAPRHIKILRSEVYEEIQKQNFAAVANENAQEELKELIGKGKIAELKRKNSVSIHQKE